MNLNFLSSWIKKFWGKEDVYVDVQCHKKLGECLERLSDSENRRVTAEKELRAVTGKLKQLSEEVTLRRSEEGE